MVVAAILESSTDVDIEQRASLAAAKLDGPLVDLPGGQSRFATDDYRERASIVAFRLSFQNAGILCGVVLGLGVFMSGSTGLLERGNYAPYAWTCAAAMVLTGLIAIGAVRRALPRLHGPEGGDGRFLAGFVREMVELSRNRSFLVLFGTVLTYFLAYSAHVSLALHASRYFWKLGTSGQEGDASTRNGDPDCQRHDRGGGAERHSIFWCPQYAQCPPIPRNGGCPISIYDRLRFPPDLLRNDGVVEGIVQDVMCKPRPSNPARAPPAPIRGAWGRRH